jgi:hypothetical protein
VAKVCRNPVCGCAKRLKKRFYRGSFVDIPAVKRVSGEKWRKIWENQKDQFMEEELMYEDQETDRTAAVDDAVELSIRATDGKRTTPVKFVCSLSSSPVGVVPPPRRTPHLAPPTLNAL